MAPLHFIKTKTVRSVKKCQSRRGKKDIVKHNNTACRVLVIESNEGEQWRVQALLRETTIVSVITAAGSFKEAVGLLSGGKTSFDVILMDLTLSNKGRDRLIADALHVFHFCPVIILTGYIDIDFGLQAVSKGIADYLIKEDLNAMALQKSIVYSLERRKSAVQVEETEKRYRDLFNLKNLLELKLRKAIVKTQEDERYEIGSELHDNVCQIMAASQLSLSILKEHMKPAGKVWYDECVEFLRLSMEEIRNLSHRLAPVFFDEITLEEALKKLFDGLKLHDNYQMQVFIDEEIKTHKIDVDIQLSLYRILQEQLMNIVRYSKAKRIEVSFNIRDNTIRMIVTDDGVGYHISHVRGGIGTTNMKRRAAQVSGKVNIASSPGKGCVVAVEIPLREAVVSTEYMV